MKPMNVILGPHPGFRCDVFTTRVFPLFEQPPPGEQRCVDSCALDNSPVKYAHFSSILVTGRPAAKAVLAPFCKGPSLGESGLFLFDRQAEFFIRLSRTHHPGGPTEVGLRRIVFRVILWCSDTSGAFGQERPDTVFGPIRLGLVPSVSFPPRLPPFFPSSQPHARTLGKTAPSRDPLP